MKILEKILEEIEKHAIEFESFGMCDDYVSVGWVKEIIRSKMDKIPKCGECSRRKWYQKGYEENEKGGAFYLGDCDEEDTCISNDLYVNAWTYLPERYKGGDDRA